MRVGAVVVAQLVDWSLPIPEVRIQSSAKNYIEHLPSTDENKEKDAGNGPFKKLFMRV